MEEMKDCEDAVSNDVDLARRVLPLRRRLRPDDVLFHEGTIRCNMNFSKWTIEGDDESEFDLSRLCKEFACCEKGCRHVFDNLTSFERHYHSEHKYRCATCKRLFPNNHLLELHVVEWHDSMFQVQADARPMYRCLLESCDMVFMKTGERKNHMITVHKYPSNFRFDRNKKLDKIPKASKMDDNSMETDASTSETARIVMSTNQNVGMDVSTNQNTGMDVSTNQNTGMDVSANQNTGMDVSTNQKAGMGASTNQNSNHAEPMSDGVESATVDQSTESKPPVSRFKYSYKVPKTICFGHGSQRGFHRPRGKPRHWHQLHRPKEDTSVNIDNVDMKDLLQSLDS